MIHHSSNWYTLRVYNGKEKKIKENLEREMELGTFLGEVEKVILPLEKIFRMRKGKKVSVEKNMYPGYLLIESKEECLSPEAIAKITSQNMVLSFLGGIHPVALKKREKERILERLGEISQIGTELIEPFLIGESVTIIDGPFTTFTGNIVKVNERKKTLKLDVKIFGRSTPVELNFSQVDKLQTA
jgi:transcriptional antiterminator NusG